MRKSQARAANHKLVTVKHTPLTDPKRALKYADSLSERFNDVVVRHVGDSITVTARNSHTPRRRV